MIFVEYVGVNMDFQIPLSIIDAIMSVYSRTHRVIHLTLINGNCFGELQNYFGKMTNDLLIN
jgi:hypothetical protein